MTQIPRLRRRGSSSSSSSSSSRARSMASPGAAPQEGVDDLRKLQLGGDPIPFSSISARLLEALTTCSKSLEAGDYSSSDKAVAELVDLLNGVAESLPSVSEAALSEIHGFLSSPSADPMAVDALSLELPKVVVKFAGVSGKCRELVEKIVDCLIESCNPRDMLAMLCEALDAQIKLSRMPIDFVILLGGLSKVFVCIKRHHVQQVKVSLPIVVNVIHAIASEFVEEEEASLLDFFKTVISIAASIRSVCEKMMGERKEELCAILGLYTLQNMAFLSMSSLASKVSDCVSFATELSLLLPFCGLSYLGLITGCDVEAILKSVSREDGDDFVTCFSSVKDGASLAVLWGSLSGEVEKAAGEHVATVVNELRKNQTKRWQAIGMVKYVLSSADYPWKMKAHSVELVLSIMDGTISEECVDDCTDSSFLIPSIFAALQAFEKVIIFATDAALRRKAFTALKKVVSDIPCSQRFDVLRALITNSSSPDMIALLIDLVKDEVVTEYCGLSSPSEITHLEHLPQFWSRSALELVELILKPTKGGPPSLPEQSLPVLSALNLYRFILIRESGGEISQKRLLTDANLRKAYTELLLPLRTLVSGIEAENNEDNSELELHTLCALNPVQVVLYRCIELVEGYLEHLK